MTDKDIVKTLEAEINLAGYVDSNYVDCVSVRLLKNALNLISRQQEEIKQLNKRLKSKKHALFKQQSYTAKLQRQLKTAKSEAYKEFAERLKSNWQHNGYYCEDIDIEDWIDNLTEKMVGED